jgi:FkbM family methyltransferase
MSNLRSILTDAFARIFARPSLIRVNKALMYLGARGLGLYNLSSERLSGERHFLEQVVPRGAKVIFDVGANEGDYVASIGAVHPAAHVYAFEPHPRTFERLRQRHGAGRTKLFNLAVSDTSGTLELFDLADTAGSQLASLSADALENLKRPVNAWSVRATTLDQFCEDNRIETIDLLKVDTEGFELAILRGARRLLEEKRISYIQFEFNEMNAATHSHMRDFKKLLKHHQLFRLLPHGMLPLTEESPFYSELYGYQNVVAVPPRG